MRWQQIKTHSFYPAFQLALINMIYREQRSETIDVQYAAGFIAWNRAAHNTDNLIPVLSEKGQFQGYKGPRVPDDESGFNQSKWNYIENVIVPDILTGKREDNTRGAVFFANILFEEETTYSGTLARSVQGEKNPQNLSPNEALGRAGYGRLEGNTRLFVYNSFTSLAVSYGRVDYPATPLSAAPAGPRILSRHTEVIP